MPQEIHVLCCFKCKMYQVDIVKKAKKWQCKMCGAKQSIFKEFFRGTGADCRQKAASTKKTAVENELLGLLERDDLNIDLEVIVNEERKAISKENQSELSNGKSKWTAFVEPTKRKIDSNSEVLDIPKKIRTSSANSSKWSAFL